MDLGHHTPLKQRLLLGQMSFWILWKSLKGKVMKSEPFPHLALANLKDNSCDSLPETPENAVSHAHL